MSDSRTLAAAGAAAHLRGELPEALQYYRSALESQCRICLRLVKVQAAPMFNSTTAQVRLWQVLAQLANSNIHAFATSGTLLGLVREGHLLPFDKDLDIGLPLPKYRLPPPCYCKMDGTEPQHPKA